MLGMSGRSNLVEPTGGRITERSEKKRYRDLVRTKFNEWQSKQTPVDGTNPGIKALAGNSSYTSNGKNIPWFNIEFPFHEKTRFKIGSTFGGKRNRKKTKRKKGGKSKNKTVKYRRRNNRKRGKK